MQYIQQRGIVDRYTTYFFVHLFPLCNSCKARLLVCYIKKGDYLNLAAGWMDRQYPRRQNMCICVDVDVYFFMPFFILCHKNMIMMYNFAGDIIGTE